MLKAPTLARLPVAPAAPITVDAALAKAYLSACERGDIDACHVALVQLQQRHPQSVPEEHAKPNRSAVRVHQPLYDLIGHGLVAAATHRHVETVEFLLSSHFASTLRDGICTDAQRFSPFPVLCDHELVVCVESIRFVGFAALACVDQLAMPAFQMLVETRVLWDHEASLCLAFAMRRALAATTWSSSSISPTAFHPMIVLLARHYDFLVDEIRGFHGKFQPQLDEDIEELRRLDHVKALQASLLYEVIPRE